MFDYWAAVSNPAAREIAVWYPEEGNFEKFHKIRVENLNEGTKFFSTLARNIETQAETTVLSTRFPYEYTIASHIFYRNKWYQITRVNDRNIPSGGFGRRQDYILSLIEVDYGRDFSKN